MNNRDLLLELLERTGLLLRTERRRVSAAHDLSEVHLAILDYLARCNRFSNTVLAVSNYLGITKGTISQSIKLLEGRGFIKKKPDPHDRRVTRLTLTAKGSKLAKGSVRLEGWDAVLASYPQQRIDACALFLSDFLAKLQKRNGYRTFQQCRGCRHLREESSGYRCGLTRQPLKARELEQICMEYEPPATGEATSE